MMIACMIVLVPVFMLMMSGRSKLIAHALIAAFMAIMLVALVASVDVKKTDTTPNTIQNLGSNRIGLVENSVKPSEYSLLSSDSGASSDQQSLAKAEPSIARLNAGPAPEKESDKDAHASKLIPLNYGPASESSLAKPEVTNQPDTTRGFSITDSF